FIIQSPEIAHPTGVDRVILPRFIPINLLFARADDHVATRRATRADALGLFEKPNAHLKTKIFGGERADRANIHCVERIIIIERSSGISRQGAVTAALHYPQRIIPDDLFAEANAPRAK